MRQHLLVGFDLMVNDEHDDAVQAAFGQLRVAWFAANYRNVGKGLLFYHLLQFGNGEFVIDVHRVDPPTRADYLRESCGEKALPCADVCNLRTLR